MSDKNANPAPFQQSPGMMFCLGPGEHLLVEQNMQMMAIPAQPVCVRLTEYRMVLCKVPVWMMLLTWLSCFFKLKTISESILKSDIESIDTGSSLGRKTLIIKIRSGKILKIGPQGLSSVPSETVLAWWNNGK